MLAIPLTVSVKNPLKARFVNVRAYAEKNGITVVKHYIDRAIPPIIPLELFEDVQEKIAKNKKAPARRKAADDYLLTTKLFCGYCGALMFGESGTSRTGEVHRYYKCATAKKHKGCKKKTVRKQWLEETKRELEARIAEEKLAKPKVTEEFIRFWLLRFRKLDMSLKDQRHTVPQATAQWAFVSARFLDL